MSNIEKNIGADGFPVKEKRENAIEPDMTPLELSSEYGTVIYLIRHGQSLGNAAKVFLGHTDKDLSPLGYEQAERTAKFLENVPIDVIYSSDLMRAYNTALPHARGRGMDVIPSRSLREIYAGEWENMRVEDIINAYPTEFIDGWRENYGMFTIPGGESVIESGRRFYDAVMTIAKENEGKRILIAAHASVIRSFWGIITKTEFSELATAYQYPENASVSVAYFDGKYLIPGEYSHAAHLKDLNS